MRYWHFPIIYFVLCEVLYLFYEISLKTSSTIGMISILILIAITFPALPVARWAQEQTATLLGISSTDTIAYNSFWPRFLGMQASIILCTLVLLFIAYLVSRKIKPTNNDTQKS